MVNISEKSIIFAQQTVRPAVLNLSTHIKDFIAMARPIAETPILYGEDAVRFEERMRQVESLTKEERAENSRKLKEAVEEAKKYITVCV